MSKVQFLGQNAGLSDEARGGNTSSPFDYFLTCQCGTGLGVLGAFGENADGYRTVWCKNCEHTTILRHGRVERVMKVDPLTLFAIPKKVGT